MTTGWKDLGVCGNCAQRIWETDSGSITGHLQDCPAYGQSPG